MILTGLVPSYVGRSFFTGLVQSYGVLQCRTVTQERTITNNMQCTRAIPYSTRRAGFSINTQYDSEQHLAGTKYTRNRESPNNAQYTRAIPYAWSIHNIWAGLTCKRSPCRSRILPNCFQYTIVCVYGFWYTRTGKPNFFPIRRSHAKEINNHKQCAIHFYQRAAQVSIFSTVALFLRV